MLLALTWLLSSPETRFELRSPLVERYRVPEMAGFAAWRAAQREFARDEAHTSHTVEDTDKVDVHVDAESFLEIRAHLPSIVGVVLVELIGEWHLCDVMSREKATRCAVLISSRSPIAFCAGPQLAICEACHTNIVQCMRLSKNRKCGSYLLLGTSASGSGRRPECEHPVRYQPPCPLRH